MNKLFLFGNTDNPYAAELAQAFSKHKDRQRIHRLVVDELTTDYLIDNSIQVVISNWLPKDWFLVFKGLGIVSIVIDDIGRHREFADIVIDYRSDDTNKYFTGPRF